MRRTDLTTDLRQWLREWRQDNLSIALVPTMGNLHDGHLSLIRLARSVADRVVVSIFVNPAQFVPGEDYNTYPRTLEADLEKTCNMAVDVVFTPDVQSIYQVPTERSTRVIVPELSDILCGASRPGHFSGVTTIVNMLFNIVQPDKAIFGEKDFQQLFIIRRMVADLHMPVEILGAPIGREADGLAMSSRNRYLTREERLVAPRLNSILLEVRSQIEQGNMAFAHMEQLACRSLEQAEFRADYVSVRNAQTLQLPTADDHDLVILGAAFLGRARLIDNVRCQR